MANWDKFEINDSGKVTITQADGKKIGEELDLIIVSDKGYFVNKKYLRGLKEYSKETLKDTLIYSRVAWDLGNQNKGITIEIHSLKSNSLDNFIAGLNKLQESGNLKEIIN